MQKPDVDEIIGLSPAISIDQKSRSNNPRSTIATITEIYDYLRVLYARVGRPHCLICGRAIHKISKEEILNTILKTITTRSIQAKKIFGIDIRDAKIAIFAPVVVGRKGEYYQLLYDLLGKGYDKVRVDGKIYRLRDQIILDKNKKHDIDVLVDEIFLSEFKDALQVRTNDADALRIPTNKSQMTTNTRNKSQIHKKSIEAIKDNGARERLSEALEHAINEANGLIRISYPGSKGVEDETLMSVKFMCPYDGFSYPEIEPRLFSFNSPYGSCVACNGLGT